MPVDPPPPPTRDNAMDEPNTDHAYHVYLTHGPGETLEKQYDLKIIPNEGDSIVSVYRAYESHTPSKSTYNLATEGAKYLPTNHLATFRRFFLERKSNPVPIEGIVRWRDAEEADETDNTAVFTLTVEHTD